MLTEIAKELLAMATSLSGAMKTSIICQNCFTKELEVVACTSNKATSFDEPFVFPLASKEKPFSHFDSEEFQKKFGDHPFRTQCPEIKSVSTLLLSSEKDKLWTLVMCNPTEYFWENELKRTYLKRIASELQKVVNLQPIEMSSSETTDSFWENPAVVDLNGILSARNPTVDFLMDTLVKKPRLLTRNNLMYVALRTWRKDMKRYQLNALVSMKNSDTTNLANRISTEIAGQLDKLFGRTFDSVVAIPGGSGKQFESLSIQIGRSLAKELKLDFVDALASQDVAKGKSHPKKSAKLKPYALKEKVFGRVILVDDVATSGKHLELAKAALLNVGCSVTAVVWIAD
jgi:hypoxanthine-guanine phosphoribosyltransferase